MFPRCCLISILWCCMVSPSLVPLNVCVTCGLRDAFGGRKLLFSVRVCGALWIRISKATCDFHETVQDGSTVTAH